ncbi:hypothetical protein GV794_28615 [Nocardia cyriacigeorgica]|uniref:Uncharacterized protein n=1 Tax=Nocardia cyriacigeorgica TaxID=135487 RepID=A0A6P1D3B8_9NOCA|nr:hypothetical protein [Nocardia cyriacigeorgica]NEW43433.1 hypothetical protein [Nocardia cyriacigeorgica]NEW51496.1 hypothetical protein [Nocardia cyriacigeorgica]NEW59557.1 hypothetical protein [Nocardia cyriacigeorgica]
MTHVDELDEHDAPPAEQAVYHEVFNPDFSVGVACDRSGMIVGIHLGDEVWGSSDHWAAAEIVRVARLAYLKSRVGRRVELLEAGVPPYTADALGLPTEAEFQQQLRDEFGPGY